MQVSLLLLVSGLLTPGLCRISSVIRLGEYYYYDVTAFLFNRKFEVRYVTDWSQGEEWLVAAADWGRRSAGASLRLSGLGEVVRGVPCGRQTVCLESDLQPGNFLVAWQEGRMVWQRQPSSSQCGHFSVLCTAGLSHEDTYERCQILLDPGLGPGLPNTLSLLAVYDKFLVWCWTEACWSGPPSSFWTVSLLTTIP